MSFINTRTSLGEQVAFDALIARTLTELNEDGIKILPRYCLYTNSVLQSVNFPNVVRIVQNAIMSCNALETIDIGKQCIIEYQGINDSRNLKALILRGTTGISTIERSDALNNTPIPVLRAGIFVPRALINEYLSNNYWNKYSNVIRAIEDMPITDFSTITHTWSQIKSMIDDESFFSTNYTIGDYKKFTYGGNIAYAEIAKIDSTNKYVDFVLKDSVETINMYFTSIGPYSNSRSKSRLDTIYADELQSDLKAVISSISKKYYCPDGTIETVNSPLWLLNTKDVNFTGSYLKENEGEEYPLFNSESKRVKLNASTSAAAVWWLGSAYNSSNFMAVNNNGTERNSGVGMGYGLIFGFRIQKTT